MRVVIDTNVIVSGLLSPYAAPSEVLRMVIANRVEPCVDARILAEYTEVLGRKRFGFDRAQTSLLVDLIARTGLMITATPLRRPLPDSDDEPFTEVAVTAHAACLITGNIKHYPPGLLKPVKVLAPEQFLRLYRMKL